MNFVKAPATDEVTLTLMFNTMYMNKSLHAFVQVKKQKYIIV